MKPKIASFVITSSIYCTTSYASANYQMNGYDTTAENTGTTRMKGSVLNQRVCNKSLGVHRDVDEVQDMQALCTSRSIII